MLRPSVRNRRRRPSPASSCATSPRSSGRENEPSDLLSYLCFDGEYAHELIKLGEADAKAREEELAKFLTG